jgi:hypothetical protein
VGHRHVLVDEEALDLVKHRRVGRVVVAAVDGAGRDERHRAAGARRHRADLHVARVRAQERAAGGRPEAVLHVGRGVVRREAELGEVVLLELDLRPVVDGEAEAHENVDDLVAHARDRVRVPEGRRRAGRQRHVERGRLELGGARGAGSRARRSSNAPRRRASAR